MTFLFNSKDKDDYLNNTKYIGCYKLTDEYIDMCSARIRIDLSMDDATGHLIENIDVLTDILPKLTQAYVNGSLSEDNFDNLIAILESRFSSNVSMTQPYYTSLMHGFIARICTENNLKFNKYDEVMSDLAVFTYPYNAMNKVPPIRMLGTQIHYFYGFTAPQSPVKSVLTFNETSKFSKLSTHFSKNTEELIISLGFSPELIFEHAKETSGNLDELKIIRDYFKLFNFDFIKSLTTNSDDISLSKLDHLFASTYETRSFLVTTYESNHKYESFISSYIDLVKLKYLPELNVVKCFSVYPSFSDLLFANNKSHPIFKIIEHANLFGFDDRYVLESYNAGNDNNTYVLPELT